MASDESLALDPSVQGKVLLLSQRRISDLVAFCIGYEFEDVLAAVTDARRIDVTDRRALEFSRRAYKLADGWRIMGLGGLSTGRLQHISGSCAQPARSNKPPALESIFFEIEPGRILPRDSGGGWNVVDTPQRQGDPKQIQIRFPR